MGTGSGTRAIGPPEWERFLLAEQRIARTGRRLNEPSPDSAAPVTRMARPHRILTPDRDSDAEVEAFLDSVVPPSRTSAKKKQPARRTREVRDREDEEVNELSDDMDWLRDLESPIPERPLRGVARDSLDDDVPLDWLQLQTANASPLDLPGTGPALTHDALAAFLQQQLAANLAAVGGGARGPSVATAGSTLTRADNDVAVHVTPAMRQAALSPTHRTRFWMFVCRTRQRPTRVVPGPISYMCCQRERGRPTVNVNGDDTAGFMHWQGYLETNFAMIRSTIRTNIVIPGLNRPPNDREFQLEPRWDTRENAVAYTQKQDCPGGRIEGAENEWREEGVLSNTRPRGNQDGGAAARQAAFIEAMMRLLPEQGMSAVPELFRMHPMLTLRSMNSIKALAPMVESVPPSRTVKIYVLYGRTGTGKSVRVRHFRPHVYTKMGGSKFWDGYVDQETVLLDDYSGAMPGDEVEELFNWLDGYSIRVQNKGGSMMPRYKEIFITSNLHPRDWFRGRKMVRAHHHALLRRLHDGNCYYIRDKMSDHEAIDILRGRTKLDFPQSDHERITGHPKGPRCGRRCYPPGFVFKQSQYHKYDKPETASDDDNAESTVATTSVARPARIKGVRPTTKSVAATVAAASMAPTVISDSD
jgi:hypothetical protein